MAAAIAGLLCLAACGSSGGDPAANATAVSWTDLGSVALDAQGRTGELRIPWKPQQSALAIEVRAAPHRCFQIDELAAEEGHVYIGRAEPGSYCVACEQRTSVAGEGAIFVLPSRTGPFAPSASLRVRFGLRHCDTLTPIGDALAGESLSVRSRELRRGPTSGLLPLRLVLTPASVFHDPEREGTLAAVLAELNARLSAARLSADFIEVTRLPAGSASHADFSRGAPESLAALLEPVPPTSALVTVVLAGCLRFREPVLGTVSEPQGYTPHIPGGAGPADAVFVAGSVCRTPGPVPIQWSASALAKVVAHELGHYLGLYHSVEADGTNDQLDDTDADNLMFYRPGAVTAAGLSEQQGEVMRGHPVVVPAP